jgi:hypothetical protein
MQPHRGGLRPPAIGRVSWRLQWRPSAARLTVQKGGSVQWSLSTLKQHNWSQKEQAIVKGHPEKHINFLLSCQTLPNSHGTCIELDVKIDAKSINKSSWRRQGVSKAFWMPKGLRRDRFGSHFRNQLRLKTRKYLGERDPQSSAKQNMEFTCQGLPKWS